MDSRDIAKYSKLNYRWGYSLKSNFKKPDKVKVKYVSYDTPEREFGVSKYNFLRLLVLSFRVAYSQLSFWRFLLLNFIFLIIVVVSFIYHKYLFLILGVSLFGLLTVPYLSLFKKNPASRIKVLETDKGVNFLS